jgi:ribonuclease D
LEYLLVACGGGKQPRCGLDDVAERWLGETLDKRFQKADWTGVLTPGHLAYAAKDAQVVLPILDRQELQIAAAGLTDVATIEHGVPGVISGKFSVRGIATNSLLVTRHDYI